jgi:nitrogen fixation NifU-like protein
MLRFSFRINDDGKIEEVKYLVFGCGSAIASSSYAAEYLKGRSVEDAEALTNRQIAQELSLPPVKLHCSLLAEEAVKAAVKQYRSRRKTRVSSDSMEEDDNVSPSTSTPPPPATSSVAGGAAAAI